MRSNPLPWFSYPRSRPMLLGMAGESSSPTPSNPRGDNRDTTLARANQSPEAVFAEVDRLANALRELTRMVDDSLITVHRAKATLATAVPGDAVDQAGRLLVASVSLLERLAESAHAALQGPQIPLGSTMLARARPVTLGEAARHACEVVAPLAKRHGVSVDLDVTPGLEAAPAGPMYAVLLNGLQNGVEAVARGNSGKAGGRVRMVLGPVAGAGQGLSRDGRAWCELSIADDGPGLAGVSDSRRFFDLGFTTKRDGAGVGLAVARSIVQGLGGAIELKPRPEGGAILHALFPLADESRAAA